MAGEIVIGALLLILVVLVFAGMLFQYESVHEEDSPEGSQEPLQEAQEQTPDTDTKEDRKPLTERVKPFECKAQRMMSGFEGVSYGHPTIDAEKH